MDDEKVQAETPAEAVIDTIIDHDAPAPESDVKDADAPDEGDESKDGDKDEAEQAEPEKPKKPSGAQRAKLREQRILQELDAARRENEELRQSRTAERPEQEQAPKEEDFGGDYFAWQRALTAFEAGNKARDAIESAFSKREAAERSVKQQQVARERSVAHAERVEDARETIPDFDSVMETMKGVNVRDELIEEIMSSDQSAVISYHLAKNPEKLQAMNSMSARELAREMGRLEATVRLPSPKKQTTAPPPLSAVKGGTSPRSADSDLQSYLDRTYPNRKK